MPYFPDQYFHGIEGDLNSWDIRYEPSNAAHLSRSADGLTRFRLVTEPSFSRATVVTGDGAGHEMELRFDERSIQVWEGAFEIDNGTRYTFALRTKDGRPVYRVPAGVSNAVERLDRWTIDQSKVASVVTPEWSHGMVMYQIFPDRFANGDASLAPDPLGTWGSDPERLTFQGGDLAGIERHLDHLMELGVDCVYVNPIFSSPSTHRYDTIDYYSVDPGLGGNEGFRSLVESLHARGIRIVVDASFNHCHPRFFAFADAVQNGPSSRYMDWFNITAWPPRVVVRRHQFEPDRDPDEYLLHARRTAAPSGIVVEEASDDGPAVEATYETWNGVPSVPRINLTHADARSYFLDVARYWVREYGIDGWRMDVTRYVDFDFWPAFRSAVKNENADAFLIAEILGDAGPWLQGDTFDGTMNYTFRQLALDFFARASTGGHTLADGLARMYASYEPNAIAASQNLLGSHDTPRFLHEAGGDPERLRLATVLQMALPGAPGLYYGDEVGMSGGDDPGSRGAFPWHEPDRWDRDQLEVVRSLSALRRTHPALRSGRLDIVARTDNGIAILRSGSGERILVVLDRTGEQQQMTLPVAGNRPTVIWGDGQATSTASGTRVDGVRGAVLVNLGNRGSIGALDNAG